LNYQGLFYNPAIQEKIDRSLGALAENHTGIYIPPGSSTIHYEYYPSKVESIRQVLDSLQDYPELTCDVETFSLKHYASGIGTISFAWDKHNGIAFCIDYKAYDEPTEIEVFCEKDKVYKTRLAYGYREDNLEIRALLKEFFISYKGKLKYHNISFDAGVLIYNLWMTDITDHHGLYIGLDVMTKDFDCTQIITYLATNSCAGNKLSLKDAAQEFAGNWANSDITDIRLIPKQDLLRYNLVDCLSTHYTYEKNYPILVNDQQEDVYLGLMKESLVTLIQMQLTGMPMDMAKVKQAKSDLSVISIEHFEAIMASSIVEDAVDILKLRFLDKDFADRKDKAKKPENIKPKLLENIKWEFNPNSGTQVGVLLHEVMGLPIIETTKGGSPSTDEDTLKALVNHTDDVAYKALIKDILGLNKVNKILSTFIPAFEKAQLGKDGIYYLFGSFKLGGTKSNRLSSSKPNLTNLPSGSHYGKIIKSCFIGNKDWIFAGADFASLTY